MKRTSFLSSVAASAFALMTAGSDSALAFTTSSTPTRDAQAAARSSSLSASSTVVGTNNEPLLSATAKIAYRSLSLDFGRDVSVPVAMWHPVDGEAMPASSSTGTSGSPTGGGRTALLPFLGSPASGDDSVVTYNHRISVKKIGELLAGWDFLPSFARSDFALRPTLSADRVVSGSDSIPLPRSGPVVLLAHGYLGSRFDLSHLAEELAAQGFIVCSAEYPESLAASYPRTQGLDRTVITNHLLDTLRHEWNVEARGYGIVGHSLGCGTVINTGDDGWARVCIAGMPSQRNSPALFISSVNDGAVSLGRIRGALGSDYVLLDEGKVRDETALLSKLPSKSALIFDRPDAPNHISFLAEGTNDAMIQLLSPLLPVAQSLGIPVLDFDKYQKSRDSRQTAEVVIPLVTSYLKQTMAVP